MESGDSFDKWRGQVPGCVKDQGVERRLARACVALGDGCVENVSNMVNVVRSGQASSPEVASEGVFLPMCVSRARGAPHGLQCSGEGLCGQGQWARFEKMVKGAPRLLTVRPATGTSSGVCAWKMRMRRS